jgi:hypothetical protein
MKLYDKQDSWRDDLTAEMRELKSLGVSIPDKAFKLIDDALIDDYQSMDNTEVVDHLIMLAHIEEV